MGLNRFVRFVWDLIGHTLALLFRVAVALGIGCIASVVVGWILAGSALPDDPDLQPLTPAGLHFIDAVTSISLKAGVVVGLGLACVLVGEYFKGLTGKENFITNLVRYIERPEVWVSVFVGGFVGLLVGWLISVTIEIPSAIFFGRHISDHVFVLVGRITMILGSLMGLYYGLVLVREDLPKETGKSGRARVCGSDEPAIRYATDHKEELMPNPLSVAATIRESAYEGPAGCKVFIATVNMPQLGEEATVVCWLNNEGDAVAKNETLLLVDTDEYLYEFPSPFTGRLTKILANEDTIVPVGAPLCEISLEQAPALR